MWKNDEDRLFAMALAIALHFEDELFEEDLHIRGTISIHKDESLISVCVWGTGEHIPIKMDKGIRIRLNGKMVGIYELPIGVYIEADLEEPVSGRSKIKNIVAHMNKTIINFQEEIKKGEERKLIKVLESTNGIYNFEIDNSSLQIYIEYDHEFLSYKSIEKVILEEGLKLEQ